MRKLGIIIGVIVAVSIGLILYCNSVVENAANGFTYSDLQKLPPVKVGLLLGTSKSLSNGKPNQYFTNRILATLQLFKFGKIQYVVISGDNSTATYDEPTDMKNELVKSGIDSNKIKLDYAGFRTFDSVVRLKEIFGQDSVVMISQQFHNERAIYIAKHFNIIAFGYNAQDVNKYYGFKTSLREKFARVKVVLDIMLGTQPKFLGDKIKIE